MATDPVTGGLTLAEKLFSFFTGEKWDEIKRRRQGERLHKECTALLREWQAAPSPEKWKRYKDAERAFADWSNAR